MSNNCCKLNTVSECPGLYSRMVVADIEVCPEEESNEQSQTEVTQEEQDELEQDELEQEDMDRNVNIKIKKASWLGRMLMCFMVRKHKKLQRGGRQKSLISRNQKMQRGGFHSSIRKLRNRTVSMLSVTSTNFR